MGVVYRVRLDLVAIAMFISSRATRRVSSLPVFATRTEPIRRRRASSRLRVRVLGVHHRPGAREPTRSRARLRPRVPRVPLLVSRDEYLVESRELAHAFGNLGGYFGAVLVAAPRALHPRQKRPSFVNLVVDGVAHLLRGHPSRPFLLRSVVSRAFRRRRAFSSGEIRGALRGCSAVMRHGGGEGILRRLVIAPAAGLGAVPDLARGCLTLDGREGFYAWAEIARVGGSGGARADARRDHAVGLRMRRGTDDARAEAAGVGAREHVARGALGRAVRAEGLCASSRARGGWGGMREGGARRPSSSRAGKVARAPARNASVSFDRPFRRESFGRPNCMARRGLWAAPGAARRAPEVFQVTTCRRGAFPRPDRPRAPSKTLVAMASTSAHRHARALAPASARLEHELRGGYQGYSRGASLPSRAPPRPVPPRASPSPLLASVHLFATSLLAHPPVVFPPFDRRRTSRPSPRARGSSVARARSARSLSTSSPACSR